MGDTCYIRDIYVDPVYRKQNMASKMADIIAETAKANGCTRLLGSVCPAANGSTASLKVLLAYGFSLAGLDTARNLIMFYKEI